MLPHRIRQALNERLQDGQTGKDVLPWLNGLPEVKKRLKERKFGDINDQNLSEWRSAGYKEFRDSQGHYPAHEEILSELEKVQTQLERLNLAHEEILSKLDKAQTQLERLTKHMYRKTLISVPRRKKQKPKPKLVVPKKSHTRMDLPTYIAITAQITNGARESHACILNGVSKQTFRRWRARLEAAERRHPSDH